MMIYAHQVDVLQHAIPCVEINILSMAWTSGNVGFHTGNSVDSGIARTNAGVGRSRGPRSTRSGPAEEQEQADDSASERADLAAGVFVDRAAAAAGVQSTRLRSRRVVLEARKT